MDEIQTFFQLALGIQTGRDCGGFRRNSCFGVGIMFNWFLDFIYCFHDYSPWADLKGGL